MNKNFRVHPGKKVDLDQWPTDVKSLYKSEADYKKILTSHVEELCSLQRRLYASNSYSVLLIFQAMDAAGKDGAISHVLSGINPQGCEVYSFKHPSAEELEHDFLWRTTCRLPSRGRIGVFNRSYYEEVLIVRVHPEILVGEGVPAELQGKLADWKGRYRSIVDFEDHMHRNGTRVIKFFLHISKDEQKRRFLQRIDEPEKNWKFQQGDLTERQFWDQYMKAYEHCLSETSTKASPWYVVPADDKKNARLIVSQVVIDTLKGLDLEYPKLSDKQKVELQAMRKVLESE